MKDGLIRLKVNRNIFYDSVTKQYRYRMHCPECGKVPLEGCICYTDLDALLHDIEEHIADIMCSAKCYMIYSNWPDLDDSMEKAGLVKDIKQCLSELTEEQSLEALTDHNLKNIISMVNPNHGERLEILYGLGDAKEVLDEYDINYYPDCEDLSEEEAQKVISVLIEDEDFDYPSGYACEV